MVKYLKVYIGAGIFIGIIALLIFASSKSAEACRTAPAYDMNIGGHNNLAMHFHPRLQIVINGQQQIIPANIGIEPGIMRPIHTHDSSGELHVESPCPRELRLGEFFEVWGRQLTNECIFEFCSDQDKKLTATLNGRPQENIRDIVLLDGDNIRINYG